MLQNLTLPVIFQLTNIISNIFITGHFPDHWKTASVIPILKPGKPRCSPDSYRPISLLPVLSKITEKLILTRLNSHLTENNILISQQHGFRPRLSTSHQLLRVVEYIKTVFKDDKYTGAIFLDIQKAFDRVWHVGLLYKLIKINTPPPLIRIIRSFLTNRTFAVRLDEATDSNKDAHFMAYVRFWDGMSAVEELLFCKPIKLKATAIVLFDILNNFINEANIEWKNCVGICTDGARTVSGRFKSIQALVKQKSPLCIWTHCMIHREALVSKEISPGLNIVLMIVVTVVNYIKMRPLKSRIFSELCKDMGAVHSSLLFYCEARWLSRGKFLQRVYELRNEITIFLEEENLPEAEKFRDGLFLMKLSYLVDIFEKLNILNLQLQGSNVHMFDTSDKINAFVEN
ncbi:zinc finger MYM-type protein 6 [Trichonephila clavipes]|nr:zinc finger MYM-type protein 6 [Trichonephila clavipes]